MRYIRYILDISYIRYIVDIYEYISGARKWGEDLPPGLLPAVRHVQHHQHKKCLTIVKLAMSTSLENMHQLYFKAFLRQKWLRIWDVQHTFDISLKYIILKQSNVFSTEWFVLCIWPHLSRFEKQGKSKATESLCVSEPNIIRLHYQNNLQGNLICF